MTQELADHLHEYVGSVDSESPWLFPSTSSITGHVVNVRKPFRRAVQAAGLDPDQVVRHTLRHTAITHLVQDGVDLPTVQRISGHKTLAMVQRYAHANGAHIQAAMKKLENRYRTI
jgi:site-specific recombinase XerD